MYILFKQLMNTVDCGEYLDAKVLNCHYEDDPHYYFNPLYASEYIKRERELKSFDMYSKSDWLGEIDRIAIDDILKYAHSHEPCAFHNQTGQIYRALIHDKFGYDYETIGLYHMGEVGKPNCFAIPTIFWGLAECQPSIYLNGSELLNLFLLAKHACPRLK